MELIKKRDDTSNLVKVYFGSELNSSSNELIGDIELDIETQVKFIDYINSIIDEGTQKILINLQNVSYIDSSGLWAIFESYKKALQRNSELILSTPRSDVKRVLDITKISTKISVFSDESDALSYFDNK